MALSSNELQQIHLRKLATPNKKYYGDDDKVYIGTTDRRLKLLNDANLLNFTPTNSISDNNVQSAIETVDGKVSYNSNDSSPIVSKSSSYQMVYTDGIIQVTTGAVDVTIVLPDPSLTSYTLNGVLLQRIYNVVKIDSGIGRVRLIPYSGTILGENEQYIVKQYDNFTFYSNGTNYFER